jgi:G3E family GTPase
MNLLLFSGFLGSGKSTLILELAKTLAAQGVTTGFIVNEVGDVGIDGQVMSDGGLDVYEITAGCICCQLGVDLVQTLGALAERYAPEVVIVEASGVATPEGVLSALEYYRRGDLSQVRIVTVVDPTRLAALLEVMTPLIESQITGADLLVVTKTDQATAAELEGARTAAGRLNSRASLHAVSAKDEASLEPLLGELGGSRL